MTSTGKSRRQWSFGSANALSLCDLSTGQRRGSLVKILYITASLPFGPGEAFLIPEVLALKQRGNTVTVLPHFPRGPITHQDAGDLLPDTVAAGLISSSILFGAAMEAWRAPFSTVKAALLILRSRNVAIVAKNAAVFLKSLWVARFARRQGFDHIHAHWGACPATIAMIASRLSRTPWSMTVHSWDILEDNLLTAKLNEALFVRAISLFGANRLPRVAGKSPIVLHVGVAIPECVPLRESHDDPGAPFRIGVIASLLPIKGHQYLLDACRLLRDWGHRILVELVGDGPLRKELESQVAKLDVQDQILFRGNVSHPELLHELACGHWKAVVLTSIIGQDLREEGIPISLVESMACGLPVIATRTGGIPELLNNEAGLIVPPFAPQALAEAIEALITRPELRKRLGQNGRRRIVESFSIDAVAEQLLKYMTNGHLANGQPFSQGESATAAPGQAIGLQSETEKEVPNSSCARPAALDAPSASEAANTVLR